MSLSPAILLWLLGFVGLDILSSRWTRRLVGSHAEGLGVPLFLAVWSYFFWLWGNVFPAGWGAIPTFFVSVILVEVLVRIQDAPPPSSQSSGWGSRITFLVAFIVAMGIRLFSPTAEIAERFADISMFQSLLHANHFPPQDLWLSGERLNYYYFGQLFWVPLLRILPIPIEYSVNLVVCTVAALVATTTYSFLRWRKVTPGWAIFGVGLAIAFGNGEWIQQFLHSHFLRTFSWWSSSRAIPDTITEFPFFSFLLGDIHAHFLALPWLTLTLAFLLSLRRHSKLGWLVLSALILGLHYPLNPWELPWMAGLAVALLWNNKRKLVQLGVLSVILYLPFWLTYERPVSYFGFVDASLRSPFAPFFLHWMLFLIPIAAFVICESHQVVLRDWLKTIVASFAVALFGGPVSGVVVLLAILLWVLLKKGFRENGFLIFGLALVLCCEWIHLDNLYGPKLARMNTVFKFYFLAWWAFSLSIPLLLSRQMNSGRSKIVKLGAALSVGVGFIYPIVATAIRIEHFPGIPTLNALVHWETQYPGDLAMVRWLRENTKPDDVILEAFGPAYQHHSRISTWSGRPTFLGWGNHERVWRKEGALLVKKREEAFARLNQNPSIDSFRDFVGQYNIRWIILGELEKKQFSNDLIAFFSTLPVSFQASGAEIRKVDL